MGSFDWLEAVTLARQRYKNGDWSLERVVTNLEYIANDAEATGHRRARALRATWGELEIVNALDLDGEVTAAPAEVDSLLLSFAIEVESAANS